MKRNLLLIAFIHLFLALQTNAASGGKDRLRSQLLPDPAAFVTSWATTADQESITIPVNPDLDGYNYSVDWGDGSVSNGQTTDATHTYVTSGVHTVSITGSFPAIQFANPTSNDENDVKLKSVDQWGTQVWAGMDKAFLGCRSLTTVPNAPGPIFGENSTIYSMFLGCSIFNADLDSWDLTKVREISFMFANATKFNGNISSWNVTNVTNMQNMFEKASAFNGNINNWKVDKVTLMDNMFNSATSFNGDIGNWNVANVTNMNSMFFDATSFDQRLGNWQIASVTSMNQMLNGSGLSPANYEATLAGWAAQNVQPDIVLDVYGLKYCATSARQSLIDNHHWSINGDRYACLIPANPDGAGIVYVDSSIATPGDGSSWSEALKYLSNATGSAEINTAIKEIHIAKGTYFPTGAQNSQDRDSSFAVRRSGLKILGGFAPGGGLRDAKSNITILSGDIGASDNSSDNNYHVMRIENVPNGSDSLIIDGVSFMWGNANSFANDNSGSADNVVGNSQGGGLMLMHVFDNTVVRNCEIIDNSAISGGGMFILGSYDFDVPADSIGLAKPLIYNCLFKRNVIVPEEGGNSPGQFGGALFNIAASPVIRNCEFIANEGFLGGAIANSSFASPVIIGSTFSENSASGISVLFNLQGANPVLINCLIKNNITTGVPDSLPAGTFDIFGNAFLSNFLGGSLRIINSTISGNHSTKPNNSAPGIINMQQSHIYITNSVIWGNQSSKILDSLASTSQVAYSLVQGVGADAPNHVLDGTADLDVFADTSKGNYRLNIVSPAINSGLNDSIADLLQLFGSKDFDNNPRIYGGTVDLGAFEAQRKLIQPDARGILYVSETALPDGDGSSWATALQSFDSALYVGHIINHNATVLSSDKLISQIWVANGTYHPAKDSSFHMLPKVKIYGSFTGNESDPSEREYDRAYSSVLQGNGNSVIRNDNNGLDNSSMLDGFVISEGIADGEDEASNGGGIYNRSVSPILSNLIIAGNKASFAGGGIANRASSPIISNVVLQGNIAGSEGGGIYNRDATGIELYNALIFDNTAKYGGGVFNGGTTLKLTNATIRNNTASIHGGGLSNGNSSIELNNSIIWGNAGQDIGNELYVEQSDAVLNFSLYNKGTENVYVDIGSHFDAPDAITTDPLFVAKDNYGLAENSPAINTGDNEKLPLWDLTDVNGNPRIVGEKVDLGAIEFSGSPLPVKMSALKGTLTKDSHVRLEWSTYTELQNKGFEVQESLDGVKFVNRNFVPSLGQGGNSTTTLQYNYDADVLSGVKYYRLQQTNLNGSTTNSNIVRLQGNTAAFHLTAYPNPARNNLHLRIEGTMAPNARVMVIDLSGRVLKTQQASANESQVDLSGLASGIYFIKYADDKQNAVIRIVKQ